MECCPTALPLCKESDLEGTTLHSLPLPFLPTHPPEELDLVLYTCLHESFVARRRQDILDYLLYEAYLAFIYSTIPPRCMYNMVLYTLIYNLRRRLTRPKEGEEHCQCWVAEPTDRWGVGEEGAELESSPDKSHQYTTSETRKEIDDVSPCSKQPFTERPMFPTAHSERNERPQWPSLISSAAKA